MKATFFFFAKLYLSTHIIKTVCLHQCHGIGQLCSQALYRKLTLNVIHHTSLSNRHRWWEHRYDGKKKTRHTKNKQKNKFYILYFGIRLLMCWTVGQCSNVWYKIITWMLQKWFGDYFRWNGVLLLEKRHNSHSTSDSSSVLCKN